MNPPRRMQGSDCRFGWIVDLGCDLENGGKQTLSNIEQSNDPAGDYHFSGLPGGRCPRSRRTRHSKASGRGTRPAPTREFQRRCEHAIVGLQMPRRCGCCTCPPAPGYVHTFNAPVETSLCEFPADPKPHRSRSIIRASHLKLGNLKPPSTAAKYIDVLCHKRTSKYTRNNLKYILPQHHIL